MNKRTITSHTEQLTMGQLIEQHRRNLKRLGAKLRWVEDALSELQPRLESLGPKHPAVLAYRMVARVIKKIKACWPASSALITITEILRSTSDADLTWREFADQHKITSPEVHKAYETAGDPSLLHESASRVLQTLEWVVKCLRRDIPK